MGGCYSSSDYYRAQPRTVQEDSWMTQLKSALKGTVSSEKLSNAYTLFLRDQGSAFIKKVAAIQGIDDIVKIPKEFSEIEYEVKFDIQMQEGKGKEPGIKDILDAFDFPATKSVRFIKDSVHTDAEGINRFYGKNGEERLVVITKGGGVFLKEKSEFMPHNYEIQYEEIVLKRKEARVAATLDEVVTKVAEVSSEEGVKYHGQIRKEKGDDFILDTSDGRIYSFTITRAHLKKAGDKEETDVQRQLEIEYAGYIPGFAALKKNSEQQIIQGMVDLSRYTFALYGSTPLPNGWRMNLHVTDERKYDFVSNKRKKIEVKIPLLLDLRKDIELALVEK